MTAASAAAAVDVLVVGAGPTGLALALQASVHGARVRLLERRTETFRPSRAMILHPRTLEVLRPLGVTGALLARASGPPEVRLHLGRREVAVGLTALGLRGTAFPHPVLVRQSDLEAVLESALLDRGVVPERGVELMGFTVVDDLVTARLHRTEEEPGAPTTSLSCRYLVGCDGAPSTVREGLGAGWRGGAYREEVVLADLDLVAGAAPVAHAFARREGLLFLFPLGEQAPWRLLVTRPRTAPGLPLGALGPPVPAEEVRDAVTGTGVLRPTGQVAWSARVQLPHRLATHFRRGPVFLAGDAAHAHSPAGGQGMNTGVQDATDLGWKLAFASSSDPGRAEPLLSSYEAERRPVARRVRALTRLLFWFEAGTGPVPAFVRTRVAVLLAPLLPGLLRRRLPGVVGLWLLAPFWVRYRRSPLTTERDRWARGPSAGDRLPDAEVTTDAGRAQLHALLADPGVHVLLDREAADLDPAAWGSAVRVHRLTSRAGRGVRVVRPDGHLGYRAAAVGPDLAGWLSHVVPPQRP